jgi:glutathione S-transferase
MKPIVYQFEHSPFCIPVTRALEASGTEFEVRNVSNGIRREIIELTNGAYYQVPVLVHDRKIIFETAEEPQAVPHYVDTHFTGGRLFPAKYDGAQNITIGYIENEVESVTFRLIDPFYIRSLSDVVERVMIIRHKERKFGAGCVDRWAEERDSLLEEAARLLAPFDASLERSKFLFGDAPVYSDFLLYGILGNMTYGGHNAIPAGLTDLSVWFETMKGFRFAA